MSINNANAKVTNAKDTAILLKLTANQILITANYLNGKVEK